MSPLPTPLEQSSAPKGTRVEWIQLDTLTGGDVLEVRTEGNNYVFVVTGSRRAFVISTNPQVSPSEVDLHGCIVSGEPPRWGTLLKGAGVAFSEEGATGTSTVTSAVREIFLRKCAAHLPAPSSNPTPKVVRTSSTAPLSSSPPRSPTPPPRPSTIVRSRN